MASGQMFATLLRNVLGDSVFCQSVPEQCEDLREIRHDCVRWEEIVSALVKAQRTSVAGEEGRAESELGCGMDVLEGVVAHVERFGWLDLAEQQFLAKHRVEGGARFGLPMLVREEAELGIETEGGELLPEECLEEEGGVELGVGYDAKGDLSFAQSFQDFPGPGHGPDRIGDTFVGDDGAAQITVDLVAEELGPDLANLDLGELDALIVRASVVLADAV